MVVVLPDPFQGIGCAEKFRGDVTVGPRLSGPEVTNVSPPHRGDAVPASISRGGPKWRGKFLVGSVHQVAPLPNRLSEESNYHL